jgi:hypothetical protein
MTSTLNYGEFVNWATIMYSQLVKELIKWEKCEKTWLREQPKEDKKKCMPFCHNPRSFVSEVVSTRRSRTIGKKKASKLITSWQEKKGEFEGEVYQK